jgi:hypothetical protein
MTIDYEKETLFKKIKTLKSVLLSQKLEEVYWREKIDDFWIYSRILFKASLVLESIIEGQEIGFIMKILSK